MPTTRKPKQLKPVPAGLTDAEAFFYRFAGWGYTPDEETPEEGRTRGARRLANAEAWLSSVPHSVQWVDDPDADRSWLPKGDRRPLYGCIVAFNDGDADPENWTDESLWSIDFGPKGMREDDTYARVVVAELASQLMPS